MTNKDNDRDKYKDKDKDKDNDRDKDGPCSLHYTIIAKTDTVDRQQEIFSRPISHIFISIINLPHFRFIKRTLGHEAEGTDKAKKLEKVHKTNNNDQTGCDNDDKIHQSRNDSKDTPPTSQRFFSQLDRREVEGLIRKYQVDLAMFGYSPQKYLNFARQQ